MEKVPPALNIQLYTKKGAKVIVYDISTIYIIISLAFKKAIVTLHILNMHLNIKVLFLKSYFIHKKYKNNYISMAEIVSDFIPKYHLNYCNYDGHIWPYQLNLCYLTMLKFMSLKEYQKSFPDSNKYFNKYIKETGFKRYLTLQHIKIYRLIKTSFILRNHILSYFTK